MRKETPLPEEDEKRTEEVKNLLENEITGLSQDNPTRCEGLIRELHKN